MSDIYRVEQALESATKELERADIFFGHGTDNAWDEACVLLLHSLGLQQAEESILQEQITPEQLGNFMVLIKNRIEDRVPAAYLTGEARFAGMRFVVDERVLVPRSPIAELIHNGFAPWVTDEPASVLDLCTGSGCIGIATASRFPQSQVVLSDLSADALELAQINIEKHNLAERCRAIQSDLFANLEGRSFDLILSNPPYVDQRDLDEMPQEYHAEPRLGLAAGVDGLDLVRPMLSKAAHHLNDGGHIIVEVGNSWVALEQAYPQVAFTWLEFEFGGEGVFILSKEELLSYADAFRL